MKRGNKGKFLEWCVRCTGEADRPGQMSGGRAIRQSLTRLVGISSRPPHIEGAIMRISRVSLARRPGAQYGPWCRESRTRLIDIEKKPYDVRL